MQTRQRSASTMWRLDRDAKDCFACGRGFTVSRRRHHCRQCGDVFCAECTRHRAVIESIHPKSLQRVCEQCLFVFQLTDQQGKAEESAPSTPRALASEGKQPSSIQQLPSFEECAAETPDKWPVPRSGGGGSPRDSTTGLSMEGESCDVSQTIPAELTPTILSTGSHSSTTPPQPTVAMSAAERRRMVAVAGCWMMKWSTRTGGNVFRRAKSSLANCESWRKRFVCIRDGALWCGENEETLKPLPLRKIVRWIAASEDDLVDTNCTDPVFMFAFRLRTKDKDYLYACATRTERNAFLAYTTDKDAISI